jgi:formyl-CoA transferase
MLVAVEQPGAPGPLTVAGAPIKMTATPPGVRRRAPLLGEHTDEVLSALGYSGSEVAGLRERGAVS